MPKVRQGGSGLLVKERMVISGDLGLWLFFVFTTSKVYPSITESNAKKDILTEERPHTTEPQVWGYGSILGPEK